MILGQGKHVYEVIDEWGKHFFSPFMEVAGVGVDSKDQVYAFVRGIAPVLIFNSKGTFLKSWGRDFFKKPHGLCVGQDDFVYTTDDDHTVRKFTLSGELVMTLGNTNKPSETGCVNGDFRTIERKAGPFNFPTNVAIDKEGNIFVSDGYGNARVHKFSKDGELLFSWGEPGKAQGQFNIPHGICIDGEGVVYVADRENSRIQLFDKEGGFLDQWDANRPNDLFIYNDSLYVIEQGYRTGTRLMITGPKDGVHSARLSIFSLDGEILSRWGDEDGCASGSFFAPHALCVDSKGSVYVGEVVISSTPRALECHTLQKFRELL